MIAVVKYNAGNIGSITNMLQRFNVDFTVSDDAALLLSADKVIFPGVGEASSAMHYLRDKNLDEVLKMITQPFLGICLGLQLMCRYSEENNTHCLHIFDVDVKKFPPQDKVPHMGWNNLYDTSTPLFNGLPIQSDVYFVHSYYADIASTTIAKTDYIIPFSASLHQDNFYAVQFHPEKSGNIGNIILSNFLNLPS